jgi:hypothetical protein
MPGIRQFRANGEEIALNFYQHCLEFGIFEKRSGSADRCVQFVDFAVRIDTGIIFSDLCAVEEACVTLVPVLCVNLHRSFDYLRH